VGEDRTNQPDSTNQRVTVPEAAELLGITAEAVRMRVKRGTLRSERQGGRVFVLLGQSQPTEQPTDRPDEPNALISQMQGRIDSLERQLEEAAERDRENRRIIAALTSRIPAIEAPQEATEAAETVEEASEEAGPHSAAGEARDELGAERARREEAETTLHEGMTEERRRREEAERERDELRRQLYARREPRESPVTVEGASEVVETTSYAVEVHESSREATEAPEAAVEQQGRGEPHPATGGAQEGARRPWWRKIFGG
jgi:hypothetical protein